MENLFADFYETVLAPGEILVGVRIPLPEPRNGGSYVKLTRRQAMDKAIVGAAALVTVEPEGERCTGVRLAMAGVGPRPIRIAEAEGLLQGRAIAEPLLREVALAVSAAVEPTADLFCSAAYKRRVAGVVAARAIKKAYYQASMPGGDP